MGPGMQTICEHTWQGFTCVTRCKFLQRFGKIERTYELSYAAAGLESLWSLGPADLVGLVQVVLSETIHFKNGMGF